MSDHPCVEDDPVAAYKVILHRVIEACPSGMRLRLAKALGKHKSFVSQITNPLYPVPVPARHLETIFEICRFSPDDRHAFLAAYNRAHPGRAERSTRDGGRPRKAITVELPVLDDPARQAELEALIRQLAQTLATLLDKS